MIIFLRVKFENWWDTYLINRFVDKRFKKVDRLLKRAYRWKNPYRISKKFLLANKDKNPHQYGETFLLTFDRIAKACKLKAEDLFIDLGSGRGRVAFYAKLQFGSRVRAFERVPEFVQISQAISKQQYLAAIEFIQEDFMSVQFDEKAIFYFNGVMTEDSDIQKLAKNIPEGSLIISVSFPFSEYDPSFKIEKRLECKYPWGQTEVYIERCQRK